MTTKAFFRLKKGRDEFYKGSNRSKEAIETETYNDDSSDRTYQDNTDPQVGFKCLKIRKIVKNIYIEIP